MFNQATVYSLSNWPDTTSLEEKLQAAAYVPIGLSAQKSVGFAPPRKIEHAALAEFVQGHIILSIVIETKSVPSQVVREEVDKRCAQIEHETGRKPGKKERRDLSDEALLTLLPAAFPKRADIPVWLDRENQLMVIGSCTQSKIDEIITLILQVMPGAAAGLIDTKQSASSAMTTWLMSDDVQALPTNISIERECTLKSTDESAACVKFSNHHLATDEVKQHITQGKLPTNLALSWDGKVSFVLTDKMQFKKIKLLDGVLDAQGTDKHEDRFDADAAISTGLLGPMIQELVNELNHVDAAEQTESDQDQE